EGQALSEQLLVLRHCAYRSRADGFLGPGSRNRRSSHGDSHGYRNQSLFCHVGLHLRFCSRLAERDEGFAPTLVELEEEFDVMKTQGLDAGADRSERQDD